MLHSYLDKELGNQLGGLQQSSAQSKVQGVSAWRLGSQFHGLPAVFSALPSICCLFGAPSLPT